MCAGEGIQRRDLGLLAEWETIESWIDDSRDIAVINPATQHDWKKKNPEIPVLRTYDVPQRRNSGTVSQKITPLA
jgi:hypothetical protein